MIGIIDTSSLVAIARYYLAIKDGEALLRFIESQFQTGQLILLSSIHREAQLVQQGVAVDRMQFLHHPDWMFSDERLLPPSPRKFSNLLENNFCIPPQKKRLSEEQFAQQKEAYMKTADARMILYALNHLESNPIVITEETLLSNDGKLFKKLPAICDILEMKHQTIAEWLAFHGVEIVWSLPPQ